MEKIVADLEIIDNGHLPWHHVEINETNNLKKELMYFFKGREMMGMYQNELMGGYYRPSYLPGELNKGVIVNK